MKVVKAIFFVMICFASKQTKLPLSIDITTFEATIKNLHVGRGKEGDNRVFFFKYDNVSSKRFNRRNHQLNLGGVKWGLGKYL